jgi:asparagine N-glycosylation enzyme membrane subunit Stt3
MIMANIDESSIGRDLPNGAGAAAILAAGIGSVALGVFTLLADAINGMKSFLNFYSPTGPLSGVTTLAIVVWLAAWFVLAKKWNGRDVAMKWVNGVAFLLLAVGFALTFPPLTDLLQGK